MGFACFSVPFLGFLVASFFIQGLEAISCPPNWFLYEQHCYGFFLSKLTWNDAETECSSHGKDAHLASILSKREMDTISSALLTGYEQLFKIWIGLYKAPGGKTRFKWLDAAVVEYVLWAPSEPSIYKGNCVQIHGSGVRRETHKTCIEALKEAEPS